MFSVDEIDKPTGSCPYLYSWDGTGFRFVTDLLGAAPLGLRLSDTQFIAADPREYVRLGDERAFPARGGGHVVQITEELREVLYLDEAKLVVVDHPRGTEVHTTGKLVPGKPFPPHELITLHRRQPLLGRAAFGDARFRIVGGGAAVGPGVDRLAALWGRHGQRGGLAHARPAVSVPHARSRDRRRRLEAGRCRGRRTRGQDQDHPGRPNGQAATREPPIAFERSVRTALGPYRAFRKMGRGGDARDAAGPDEDGSAWARLQRIRSMAVVPAVDAGLHEGEADRRLDHHSGGLVHARWTCPTGASPVHATR